MIGEKQSVQNHLKKSHLAYIGGPILFTAPHSKRLMRGGKRYGEKRRQHLRETYTSYLAIELANLTKLEKNGPINSFCFWGKSSQINEEDDDPNYLLDQMLDQSQFHLSLHAWAQKHKEKPILHVDVHGKLNREHNCHVDVGIKSIECLWENDPLLKHFQIFFKELNPIFKGLKFRQFECTFDTDPALHGFWGGNKLTMTTQAIKLGIPSFQLQIPNEIRKKLFKDKSLLAKFAEGISTFYQKIIVPYTKQMNRPRKINPDLALKFSQTLKNKAEVDECRTQVIALENKQELQLNKKKI